MSKLAEKLKEKILANIKLKKKQKHIPLFQVAQGERKRKKLNEESEFGRTHDALAKHYEFDPEGEHAYQIAKYTDESRNINAHLFQKEKNPDGLHADWSKPIKYNDEVTSKYATPKELTVYSGLHNSPHEHIMANGGYKSGSHVLMKHPAYMSTSLSKDVAREFAHPDRRYDEARGNVYTKKNDYVHILKTTIPKGSNHGAYIGHLSLHPEEKEFVLGRGKVFKVSHRPYVDHKNKTVTWSAKIHDENDD